MTNGIRLTGGRLDMDSLAGWVAGEANHAVKKRRTRVARIFNEIANALECELGTGFGASLF